MSASSLSHTVIMCIFFFFSSRRRHTRFDCDWSSDVCSSDLPRLRNCRSERHSQRVTGMDGRKFDAQQERAVRRAEDRKSTRLNSSHSQISYAVFCLKKKKNEI